MLTVVRSIPYIKKTLCVKAWKKIDEGRSAKQTIQGLLKNTVLLINPFRLTVYLCIAEVQ